MFTLPTSLLNWRVASLAALFLLSYSVSYSQTKSLDSTRQIALHSKDDSVAAMSYRKIAKYHFEERNYDSTVFYAKKGYARAEKHDILIAMWVNLAEQCYVYQVHANYPKALSMYLDFLKLCDEKKDLKVTVRVLQLLSELYFRMGDYNHAIAYAQKNTPLIIQSDVKGGWLFGNIYSIGMSFINLKQPDSALSYFQKGYTLANNAISKGATPGFAADFLLGMGIANQQLGNNEVALAYLNQAIQNNSQYNNKEDYFAYMQKAVVLNKMGKFDSAAVYYQKALDNVVGAFTDQAEIYKSLANIYKIKDPVKAVKYFSLEQQIRDSLFDAEKLNAIQTLTYNEQERQKELVNQQKEELAAHKRNIENISIIIGIISFVILFLLLSRSVIVNEKWVRFLGVIGLLILFEFINLLLHPLLEEVTHHSSFLMLVIMVSIAALLVPLHHRIEKWVTRKMVEKNKKVRLAAAKKIIAKLEAEEA